MSAAPSPQKRLSGKELGGLGVAIIFGSIMISIYTAGNNINEVVYGGLIGVFLGIAVPVFLGVRQYHKRTHLNKAQRKQLSGYNVFTMIGEVKEYIPGKDEDLRYTGKQYVIEPYNPPIVYTLPEYLSTKAQNRNIAVIGMSGMGKTTLLYQIIMHSPYHKIIFVVKGFTDLYAKLPVLNGHPIPTLYLNKYSPDVFSDKHSFIASFEAAFSPASQGITAAAIPSLLKQILDEMKTNTWKEFEDVLERILDHIDQKVKYVDYQGFLFIMNNLQFIIRENQYTIKLPPDIVVDFSDMSEQEIAFYGEFLMRQIFNELSAHKREKSTFFMDEGQVFLDAGSRSIINNLAALIRASGSFVVSTQMLSTIGGPILGNCATQFSFRITGYEDLNAVRAVDPMYAWTVSQVEPYTFVDLNQSESHSKIIIFSIYNPNINTMPPIIWRPEGEGAVVEGTTAPESITSTAVQNEIEAYIMDRKIPPGILDISYHFARKYGWDEKEVQLKLKDNDPKSPLHDLIQGGRVSSFYFDYAGRPVKLPLKKLYYQYGGYQAHDFVRDYVNAIIQKRYPSSPARIGSHGESVTDIIWEAGDAKYSIEIEMDTKRGGGVSETELRIRRYQQDGYTVLVVAPNAEAKESVSKKYEQLEVQVYTPREFAEKFKGAVSSPIPAPTRERTESGPAVRKNVFSSVLDEEGTGEEKEGGGD